MQFHGTYAFEACGRDSVENGAKPQPAYSKLLCCRPDHATRVVIDMVEDDSARAHS